MLVTSRTEEVIVNPRKRLRQTINQDIDSTSTLLFDSNERLV
jgi:hypothetical protein